MAQPDPSNARPAAAGPETPARPADPSRAVAFVSTHCSIRNWAERRLYEPLAGRFRLEAIFWDRGRTMSPLVMQEAERFRIGVHEYRNERWGLLPLFDFYRHVVRSLDGIPASQLGWVVAADTDVLIPVLWHRLVRGRRYRVIREEVDYYAGSRNRGRGAGDAFRRLVFDALEALLHTQCDTVITLNRHAGARLRAWGVPESRLRIGGLWMKDEYMSDDREAAKAVLRDASVLTAEQYERVRGRRVISSTDCSTSTPICASCSRRWGASPTISSSCASGAASTSRWWRSTRAGPRTCCISAGAISTRSSGSTP
jgi:hypothetical protein